MNEGVQLLCYADRLGGDISGLRRLLSERLKGFSGVHLLPFFVPFDGDDAGFDPIDHGSVDPRLGSWPDVQELAGEVALTADLIVNHVSAQSAEFQDWLAKGEASEYAGMFLRYRDVFPDGGSEAEIAAFYRPRPGLPFTDYQGGDGSRLLLWTTFMPSQIDLNVRHPAGEAYLDRILRTLLAAGVSTVRIDAVGYAIKTPGTDSFMTEQTLEYVRELVQRCHDLGLKVLVEVHAHFTQQLAIAPLVDYVYDFATPALLFHCLRTGSVDRLLAWDAIRPRNTITVLDTHDGIGIIDAGPLGGKAGLLTQDEMAAIFAWIDQATAGVSGQASVVPTWFTLPHQANTTFFDALGRDADAYLLTRAVQFFLPGIPQVYYVGLLAGGNDLELWQATGQGREVNRHHYSLAEIDQALATPIVQAIFGLIALRQHPAFSGDYHCTKLTDSSAKFAWTHQNTSLTLTLDMSSQAILIESLTADVQTSYRNVA
ncbi:MAG: sucrose phosphorylase, partial [Propionibacteriaceae bacterium]|nr:sucrose phosphorylase [Propionibacteriaceae bacterium]